MGSVEKLADQIREGLCKFWPELRQMLKDNFPLWRAAIIEARTASTTGLANYLALNLMRTDLREQWLRRLLSNKFLDGAQIIAVFAKHGLRQASRFGRVIELRMDQTEIGVGTGVVLVA